MTDSNEQRKGMPSWIYAQIVVGVAVQVVVFFQLNLYWAICATPLVFATFAAINLTDLDKASDRRIKSILTWVTFGSIAVAVLCRMFWPR